jgi:2-polyprenyl-3-methyl-5-hydroxy-6-metoxy-1,4-benzoquinol methylase
MSNIEQYRASENERARTADLLPILPRGRRPVLDVGARDGQLSRLLTEYFDEVTALDLQKPGFEFARVVTVAGNVTKLEFADDAFDCVFCAEVLERIPDLTTACQEILLTAKLRI